jgi:hypothetical protein
MFQEKLDVVRHSTEVTLNSQIIVAVNSVDRRRNEVVVTIGRTGLPNVVAELHLSETVLFDGGSSEKYEIRVVDLWPLSMGASFTVTSLE